MSLYTSIKCGVSDIELYTLNYISCKSHQMSFVVLNSIQYSYPLSSPMCATLQFSQIESNSFCVKCSYVLRCYIVKNTTRKDIKTNVIFKKMERAGSGCWKHSNAMMLEVLFLVTVRGICWWSGSMYLPSNCSLLAIVFCRCWWLMIVISVLLPTKHWLALTFLKLTLIKRSTSLLYIPRTLS